MKYLCTLGLLCLIGCAQTARRTETLSASQARQALAEFVTVHPEVFVSPGRAESPSDIRKAPAGSYTAGIVGIGWFTVNLDKKTYLLLHDFGEPGSGWFENWVWEGCFSRTPEGEWKAEKPHFRKEWGQ